MTKPMLRVGITSSGGVLVPSAVHSMRKNIEVDFNIHAFNSSFDKLSECLADKFDIIPTGSSPDFIPKILDIVSANNIEVLLPWSDEEAFAVSYAAELFLERGCKVLVSPPKVLNTISDKVRTYQILEKCGLKVPEYAAVSSKEDAYKAISFFGFPHRTVIVKPAKGRGGRGVTVYLGEDKPPDWIGSGTREKRTNSLQFDQIEMVEGERYLVMPCLSSPVFDVDVLRLRSRRVRSFVRERINPTGIPFKGNILRENSKIAKYATDIAEALNLQSLHDIDMMSDHDGSPVLLEVNPRPSGSAPALSFAGYPLIDYALASIAGIKTELNEIKQDIQILPYVSNVASK